MTTQSQPTTLVRLDSLQKGAGLLLGISLISALALLLFLAVGLNQSRPVLFGALHALNFGATMMIAVGGIYIHKGIIESLGELRAIATETRGSVKRMEQIEARILGAVKDELAERRLRASHHN